MLGVYHDLQLENAQQLKRDGEITWRNFHDESCSPAEASMAYKVVQRPASFLIDRSGVVRHVNVFDRDALVAAIESLLNSD